jgi:type II restriction/modification system DNA methylase subunit YeeA
VNTSQLSRYAPQARNAFIEAVSAQTARLGITVNGNEPAEVQGDVLLIGGQAFPASDASARRALADRVEAHGFDQTMETIAYTWFNRFVAIRYMELHGYLDHGYRVLSHPEAAGLPEILDHAAEVDLPGLDREQVIELKLDGTQDEALYRLLLLAQCNALHQSMPFLFEPVGAGDELLLPANLLYSDSLIRQLVESIDEELWQDIEIIGWLYQFYVSEKKDQVIGKVVKSEDIPAATQLFTPNWIVKYMVQNSLGAQWLATYPQSPLKGQMEYYIDPAEQTDDVNAQLAITTPSLLNPEELTLIDPASGSGHILVEAYELFKAIYLERGYRQGDVPQLILERNLYGLDIDERAAQLTGFALMMKGRADDRRLFERGVKLNVMALVDSAGFDAEGLAKGGELGDYGLKPGDLAELTRLFEHATTFGSLIQVPEGLAVKLPSLKQLSEARSSDFFVSEALKRLGPLVQQAQLLAAQYDAVVANPPYMGSKHMNSLVKTFAKDHFPAAKSDVFACFIERGYTLAKRVCYSAMVTMHSWMFLSSLQEMRERLLREKTIRSMVHIGYNSFPTLNSKVAQATAFIVENTQVNGFTTMFVDLNSAAPSANKHDVFLAREKSNFYQLPVHELEKIPGSPLAYWSSGAARDAFDRAPVLSSIGEPKQGLATANNDRFVRSWFEVSLPEIEFGCGSRNEAKASSATWFPYNKGGEYRKWYGNQEHVVNWASDGQAVRAFGTESGGKARSRAQNTDYYFRRSVSWSFISWSFGVRVYPEGFVFDVAGSSIFGNSKTTDELAALLCSTVAPALMGYLNPTLNFQVGNIASIPVIGTKGAGQLSQQCQKSAKSDWDSYETSWDFQSLPLLTVSSDPNPTLESSYAAWITRNRDTMTEMKRLEEENNHLFIDAYSLGEELIPDVPIEQITLTVNPAYRYGGKLTVEEQWTRFRQDTMAELVSYAIGCMMGRYSLDAPGFVYAHSGNEGFDAGRYPTFPADDDGIVPLTDTEWFEDDAAHRLIEFISVVFDKVHLEANLTFLADNLSPKKNESGRQTLRRYLRDSFFKDHLQTYKKRPIYWLFSSGKQKAFQCLVYLHRYNEGTLSRMRSEYVIPLQGKMASRMETLQQDVDAATSTAHQRRLEKERSSMVSQQGELLAFDEKLRHYADRRISLDLDDGVKVNYAKFGDLLAEVKVVAGGRAE